MYVFGSEKVYTCSNTIEYRKKVTGLVEKNEKNVQNEMEKKTKMTIQEDSNSKEDSKEVVHEQESDENDEGRSEGKKGKDQDLEESTSAERKHLFGIPMDEQIVKFS